MARHPELVRTLVAHEAPLMEMLPDAARWRTAFAEIGESAPGDAVDEGLIAPTDERPVR